MPDITYEIVQVERWADHVLRILGSRIRAALSRRQGDHESRPNASGQPLGTN
jgi:hypothetical protein